MAASPDAVEGSLNDGRRDEHFLTSGWLSGMLMPASLGQVGVRAVPTTDGPVMNRLTFPAAEPHPMVRQSARPFGEVRRRADPLIPNSGLSADSRLAGAYRLPIVRPFR